MPQDISDTAGRTVIGTVVSNSIVHSRIRDVVAVLGFCLLITLSAQVRIPVPGTLVPMTLQSTAVLLTGFCLAPASAAAAMLIYLFLGAAGIPVFAAGSAGFAGITGGYLMGFLPASAAVSLLRRGSHDWKRLTISGIAGTAIVFMCGLSWQVVFSDSVGSGGAVWQIVAMGLLPFLPKAIVQLMTAVAIVSAVRVAIARIMAKSRQ